MIKVVVISILSTMILAFSFPVMSQLSGSQIDKIPTGERIRLIVETDAGGDPDDEQSLVRFLLYANEWDVEGIIANRAEARERENKNPVRTGLGIVRAMITAYGECYPNLALHDSRYPTMEHLWERTVPGYADTDDGVDLIIAAADSSDPRPVWFLNWGTDHGSAESSLKRALDKILKERGPEGYAKFKSRLRLSSSNKFEEHTWEIKPPFPLWVDTMQPEIDRKRWYHQFSVITAKAGGFDIENDVRQGHGPLGPLYPLNTNRPQKEGDTMTFLYFLPRGLSNPSEPTWGSWAGRHGLQEKADGRSYYWANQQDAWQGSTSRENTLLRWAVDLQNDFKARMDWCVKPFSGANHAPIVRISGDINRRVRGGERVVIDARKSSDPDKDKIQFLPVFYPEAGTYQGVMPELDNAKGRRIHFRVPEVSEPETLHLLVIIRDDGTPALTGYQRVVLTIVP